MGKKQHQKDKLYLTSSEWRNEWGGYKGIQNTGQNSRFRRLPFHCCSLSLQPFEHPYCTKEGVVYDLMNILPFVKKYGINPATGEKISSKDLFKLEFHKNAQGHYHCPVTFKVFNSNTHIVAIRTSGNVYSYDAVERLNIKPSNFRDLLTDEPFTRKDIITIQDPTNLDKFNISDFFHLKNNLKVATEEETAAQKDSRFNLRSVNSETLDVLDELDKTFQPTGPLGHVEPERKKADKLSAAPYSTGRVAASFTSTAISPETQQEADVINEDVLRYERVKKKGYVRIMTNKGPLNLELHCEMVPKVCENFIKHCASGYYNNTIFHRSIRNFMIQGGDPEGTGKGGQSAWGGTFEDHFKPNLTHTGRGILSMANQGPNTNKSQFFITYRSARHLDGKHSVFGRVVGGLETLDAMEKVEVDKKDRPKEEMKIESCLVFVNPFEEADELLKKEREEEAEKQRKAEEAMKKKHIIVNADAAKPKVYRQGVGKFISTETIKRASDDAQTSGSSAKKPKGTYGFKDFSDW